MCLFQRDHLMDKSASISHGLLLNASHSASLVLYDSDSSSRTCCQFHLYGTSSKRRERKRETLLKELFMNSWEYDADSIVRRIAITRDARWLQVTHRRSTVIRRCGHVGISIIQNDPDRGLELVHRIVLALMCQ